MSPSASGIDELLFGRFGVGRERGGPVGQSLDSFFARTLARSSCRDFRVEPVEDGLFDLIVATALCASSKSDLQQASIIEIASPEQRAGVAALVPGLAWLRTAPRLVVVCADAHRYEAIAELHGIAIENGDLEGFFNATVDAALVLQTLILAAEAAGLGSCPVSGLRHQAAGLSRLLALPARVMPIAGLALGHPRHPPVVKPRLPRSLTVHLDRYAKPDVGKTIRSYDLLRSKAQEPGGATARPWSEERSIHHDPTKSALFHAFVVSTGFDIGVAEEDPAERHP
jgi:nitroreductase